jgi:hypothetical protein
VSAMMPLPAMTVCIPRKDEGAYGAYLFR